MCNLYSTRRSREEIARLFGARVDTDLGALPGVFPDRMAPVVIAEGGGRVLTDMRWGFPPPPAGGQPVTNVRNTSSSFWRPWLKPGQRCLVPFTSFSEYSDTTPKVIHWFAAGEERSPLAFAGIWRTWSGTRGTKAAPVEGEHRLYAFLTTEPNAVVKPVHAKAMPVVLEPEDWETWLSAPAEVALSLQCPARDDLLSVVATGSRSD